MDKESFKDTLQKKYVDDIREAYRRCEHKGGTVIDHSRLWTMVSKLLINAKADGIAPTEFEELAKCALPGFFEKCDFTGLKKAA